MAENDQQPLPSIVASSLLTSIILLARRKWLSSSTCVSSAPIGILNIFICIFLSTASGCIYFRFFPIILLGAAPLSPSFELSSRISFPSLELWKKRLLLREGEAKAEVVVAIARRVVAAIRRATVPLAVVTATATKNPARPTVRTRRITTAITAIQVLTPFPNVSTHVVDA